MCVLCGIYIFDELLFAMQYKIPLIIQFPDLTTITIQTWLENVEADMAELEIDKKWRRNVMKRKSNLIGKRTINR